MKEKIWKNIESIRENSPLVHNITNYVVMNNTANALLAAGASPVMAHAVEEVKDMVGIASSLVINIGTLSEKWVQGMRMAMQAASKLNKPVAFDPVGMGATPYRNQVVQELIALNMPSVIRGNASEISAIFNTEQLTRGVDSTISSENALDAARELQNQYGCVICVSGSRDYIIGKYKVGVIENGHPLMGKITGMGCTATALIGAFLAVQPDYWEATVSAMAFLGVAGEIAAATSSGPGSLQLAILDKLYNLKRQEFDDILKYKQL
jgi:hydroxyethylthiazole kinase